MRYKSSKVSRLRIARVSAGLSQTELARTVGISQVMISYLELGKTRGSAELRSRIAAALGRSEARLFPKRELRKRRR